jgi:hypothetical protein
MAKSVLRRARLAGDETIWFTRADRAARANGKGSLPVFNGFCSVAGLGVWVTGRT